MNLEYKLKTDIQPKMDVCFILDLPRGGNVGIESLFYIHSKFKPMNKRKRLKYLQISIRVEGFNLIKVKSYKRRRGEKIEKVKSHYRRNFGSLR